jgi:hypothetical protein
MVDRLRVIFANVNDWLKFAEAKNAMLVAIAGAVCFAALSLLKDQPSFPILLLCHLYSLTVFGIAALAVALFSFLPQTKITNQKLNGQTSKNDNLLFYGHIGKYGFSEYLDALYAHYDGGEARTPSKEETDYACQTVINSRITARKFAYFEISLWLMLAGVATPIIGAVLYLFLHPNKEKS